MYKLWLEKVVNPSTNEYYLAKDENGIPIKGKTAKHVVRTIVRLRKRDGSEFLYSHGNLIGYNSYGDIIRENCIEPEVWKRVFFRKDRVLNIKSQSYMLQTKGPNGFEIVYELPFNEKNLKEIVNKRIDDYSKNFIVKEENGRSVEVKKEPNTNDTVKLFTELSPIG